MRGGFYDIHSIVLMSAVNVTKKRLSTLNKSRKMYRGFRNYRGMEVLVRQSSKPGHFLRGRIVGKPAFNEKVDYRINTSNGWELPENDDHDLVISYDDIKSTLFLKDDYLLPGARVGVIKHSRNVSDIIVNFGIIKEVHKTGLVPTREPKYTISLDSGELTIALERNVILEKDFLPEEVANEISSRAVSDNEWMSTIFKIHNDEGRLLKKFITMKIHLNDIRKFLTFLVEDDNNLQFIQLMYDNGYDLSPGNIDKEEDINTNNYYGFHGVVLRTRIIDAAAGYGSTNIVKWLYNNGHNVTTETIKAAHNKKRAQTVWWICRHTNVSLPVGIREINAICANPEPPTRNYYVNQWR